MTDGLDATPVPGDGLRVLIVDDNVDHATMMAELVRVFGYDCRTAFTAAEGLRVCDEYRPRVVLLDLGLPDEHGYSLAARMRAIMGTRRITFVAVTGWNMIADQLKSTAAGISHHLVKPVNREALRAILDGYYLSHARNSGAAPRPSLSSSRPS